MKKLVDKYAQKLVDAGLTDPGAPLIGGLDAELTWNRSDPTCTELEKVFNGLNINSLLYAQPAEPYRSIIDYLASQGNSRICPQDSETRTFMHDLPVIPDFDATQIVYALKERKCVIIPGRGLVTWGMVSPEQAFIFYSSACFACFVKFFSDYLNDIRAGTVAEEQHKVFKQTPALLPVIPEEAPTLMHGPFTNDGEVLHAMCEVGRATVEYGLVDSFFGNLSYRFGNTLYVSQTGSSLDELGSCIDACPLDESSCASVTASSEYTAHKDIVLRTDKNAILHGHPKFAVILSLDCERPDCERAGQCHIKCNEKRFVDDIPIVPGEVGTGPYGLCHTLPPAIKGHRGVIVYGHGLFTVAQDDYNEAFKNLLSIERQCRDKYFERVQKEIGVRR